MPITAPGTQWALDKHVGCTGKLDVPDGSSGFKVPRFENIQSSGLMSCLWGDHQKNFLEEAAKLEGSPRDGKEEGHRKGKALSASLPFECFPESEAGSRGWRQARLSGKREPGGSQKPACRGMSGWGGRQAVQLWFNLGFFLLRKFLAQ